MGTGFRVDFSYFLLRLDWAFKVKDPFLQANQQWFHHLQLKDGQFQLGVTYPF